MRSSVFLALAVSAVLAPGVRAATVGAPEGSARLDEIVFAAHKAHGVVSAGPCSDAVFLRRAYLDAIGTLPTPEEARGFLDDRRPDRRARLIDALLARPEFADYWALKWCDVLRVKSEFPINLWPNAVQAYHRWIRDAVRDNTPYDRFARALLTSSGSNFRVPPVNFYRAVQGRDARSLAGAAALTFMGTRLELWPEERQAEMASLFSRVAYKRTGEWKEEIVCLDPTPSGPLEAVLPDGTRVTVAAGEDPRVAFADWLLRPDNPWFARCAANRVWAWLLGRGVVEEADDIREDNPPSCPELLAYLEGELVASGYDLRALYRLILNSEAYQQSPVPRSTGPQAEALFAAYPVRRLDAEVLVDALCAVIGGTEEYTSPIPEPYTFVPTYRRTIELADGSITSSLLELLGRPARDTGLMSERSNGATDSQRLYLLNSADIQQRIGRAPGLRRLAYAAGCDRRAITDGLYLLVLSRHPTEPEHKVAEDYLRTHARDLRAAVEDLAWALINSKEFLYRH